MEGRKAQDPTTYTYAALFVRNVQRFQIKLDLPRLCGAPHSRGKPKQRGGEAKASLRPNHLVEGCSANPLHMWAEGRMRWQGRVGGTQKRFCQSTLPPRLQRAEAT